MVSALCPLAHIQAARRRNCVETEDAADVAVMEVAASVAAASAFGPAVFTLIKAQVK